MSDKKNNNTHPSTFISESGHDASRDSPITFYLLSPPTAHMCSATTPHTGDRIPTAQCRPLLAGLCFHKYHTCLTERIYKKNSNSLSLTHFVIS